MTFIKFKFHAIVFYINRWQFESKMRSNWLNSNAIIEAIVLLTWNTVVNFFNIIYFLVHLFLLPPLYHL